MLKQPKLLALFFWAALLLLFWWYGQSRDLNPVTLVARATDIIADKPYGVLLFFAVYALRQILLFPVTLLIVAAGFIFGPVLGLFYGFIATLGTAVLGYLLARYFLSGLTFKGSSEKWRQRLQHKSFETVLISRLLFLPGDLVNGAAGALAINLRSFTLATAIGGFPGLLASVLFGASFEGDLAAARPQIDSRLLLSSAMLMLVSLLLSAYLRRHKQAD